MEGRYVKRYIKVAYENSALLVVGAIAGLAWANLDHSSYIAFRDVALIPASAVSFLGEAFHDGVNLHALVNEVLMALFFALAGKEIWSAMLPGGALRGVSRAAMPVVCAVGGMTGPALIYLAGATLLGQLPAIGRGWAIPCATDVAFSYMIALLVFGKGHPAIPFLLLLAIADDALGLIVLAIFYPQNAVQPLWLLLPLAAVLLGLAMRRYRVKSVWWYLLLPGGISWLGLAMGGLHPALGLLPVIPTLPHGRGDEDYTHWGILPGNWALDRLDYWWKNPVQFIVGLFGLLNAGVPLTAVGDTTYLVVLGLLFGKPIGIFFTALLLQRVFRLSLPQGLSWRAMFVVGCAAGIGFTVALFVATVAFPAGALQDASKMGALLSVSAVVTTLVAAGLLGVKKDRYAGSAGAGSIP